MNIVLLLSVNKIVIYHNKSWSKHRWMDEKTIKLSTFMHPSTVMNDTTRFPTNSRDDVFIVSNIL